MFARTMKYTHHTDELRQRHLNGDGDLLALINSWSDQFVVALGTQQVVHQALLCVLRSAACTNTKFQQEHSIKFQCNFAIINAIVLQTAACKQKWHFCTAESVSCEMILQLCVSAALQPERSKRFQRSLLGFCCQSANSVKQMWQRQRSVSCLDGVPLRAAWTVCLWEITTASRQWAQMFFIQS